jgi:VCBS repeat protein
VTNTGDATVSVLLGNGDGTFQPAQDFLAGNLPSVVVTGDFDNDGTLDLAVANQITGGVSVLLGNGDGTFQQPRHFALLPDSGLAAFNLAVGHFHDPNILDLVAATPDSSGLILLLGNGDGTFQPGRPLLSQSSVQDVAVGDFNGDGKDDLVTINRSDPQFPGRSVVDVLLGNGDGTFGPPVRTELSPFDLSDKVKVADLNGDGIPDVLTVNRSTNPGLGVLFGNGDGTFQVGPSTRLADGLRPDSVAIADFNGDGIPDLAIAFPEDDVARQTTVSVLLGNGDGTFQAPLAFDVGVGPTSLAVGDFNSDGLPDLAVANVFSNDVSVLLNGADNPLLAQGGSAPMLSGIPSGPEVARIDEVTNQPAANAPQERAAAETLAPLPAEDMPQLATDAVFAHSHRPPAPKTWSNWVAQEPVDLWPLIVALA